METPVIPSFITTEQVAERLQISPPTAADYARRGWLKGQRIGRAWRIDAASVDRLLRCGPPARR